MKLITRERPKIDRVACPWLAASLGLSAIHAEDDHAMLKSGFVLYDALYAWARKARGETHGWPPKGT